ncbi:MAG: hypothetical protein K6L73_07440 [Cellvibrionaceae bacterium]
MDFKKERVNFHNNFPDVVQFKAERKLKERLGQAGGITPFLPIKLGYDNDVVYQTCVGHLLDGLEFLPYRPDYMFDHCFKVIDEAGSILFVDKGIKGIVQGLPAKLLNHSRKEWESVIDFLGGNIPLMTCRFLVKRVLEAYFLTDRDSRQLVDRSKKCFGVQFFEEFVGRFAQDDSGRLSGNISSERISKGASFLKLYLSGKRGTRKVERRSNDKLDLTKQNNIPTHSKRIELLLSLLLFNMRNERFHGAVLSPFRTSKSSIERYQSYYFAMLCSYIFCLGVLSLRGVGALSGKSIEDCAEQNIKLQVKFFN